MKYAPNYEKYISVNGNESCYAIKRKKYIGM